MALKVLIFNTKTASTLPTLLKTHGSTIAMGRKEASALEIRENSRLRRKLTSGLQAITTALKARISGEKRTNKEF